MFMFMSKDGRFQIAFSRGSCGCEISVNVYTVIRLIDMTNPFELDFAVQKDQSRSISTCQKTLSCRHWVFQHK